MTYQPLAIVASTVDDSHIWNLTGVELELRDRGFEVRNMGCCTPPERVAESVRDHRPELTVISSVNGHGALSGLALAETLMHYQAFSASTIVIGGKLTIDNFVPPQVVLALKRAGYSAVLSGPDAWRNLDRLLDRNGLLPSRQDTRLLGAASAYESEVVA
tara:strand:- start:30263 stop:30742 length:480 start_codon:yes stop_codon:yes gene_type:complete